MQRKIPQLLTVMFSIVVLSACNSLSSFYSKNEAPEPSKTGVSESAYIDYWQTRDPVEYRQAAATTKTRSKKAIKRSQDVIISSKKQNVSRKSQPAVVTAPASAPTPATSGVSLTIPVQPGSAVPVIMQPQLTPQRGNRRHLAMIARPTAAIPATEPPKNVSGRKAKGKRKSGSIVSKNLWDRVRARSLLVDIENVRIDEQIAYLKRNPGYLNLLSERSRPYLHYIVEEIDRRGMPMDLALLPMVESAFEPTAVSPKAAAGLWQIIPSTGQEWGLTIVDGYDGRLDVHTSTGVALNYLRYLNKRFKGDWLLALAAYNVGPNAVQDAIEANAREEAQAAAAAKKLAAQQQAALAATAVREQPDNLSSPPLPPILQQPPVLQQSQGVTATILPSPTASVTTTMMPAAKGTTGIGPTTTKAKSLALAPVVALPAPSPAKPESVFWRLKLPKETQDYVPRILALARMVAAPGAYGLRLPQLGNRPYLFRVDTTITPEVKIADALLLAGIPSGDFFRFNPGFKPGVEPPPRTYSLLLPLEQAQSLAANVPGVQMAAAKKYTVRKGETIASIAKRHGVPSMQLAQWNHLEVNTVLQAGQQLIVYPSS
ncbi:MAG: transglycosylase SLT domain-containing protein [Nitrosomonas ureae]